MATNADGSVQRRAADRVFPAAANENDDDDDSISLTSTVAEEVSPDTEYVVEGVRAEDVHGRVLVEWANFPLDQCTWEPIVNLPQELRDEWEQQKQDQDPSVTQAFRQKYEAALREKKDEARQRHRRRNAKRQKLGMPTTPFYFNGQSLPDSGDELKSAEGSPDGEADESTRLSATDDNGPDEANEDDANDSQAATATGPSNPPSQSEPQKTTRPPNRIFTFDPDKEVPRDNINVSTVSSKQALHKSSKTSSWGRMSTPKAPRPDREKPAKSGYQGSARKPRELNLLPNRPGNAATKAAVAVPMTAPKAAKKSFTARKTGQQAAINIFKEGKIRKPRQGIGEIEVDSGRQGKLYNRHQYRRKAELRARDKEDQAPDIEKVATSLFAPGSAATASNTQTTPRRQTTGDAHDDDDAASTMREELAMHSGTAMRPTQAGRADSTAKQPPKSALASPTIASTALQNSKRGSLSLEKNRPKKKPKSVRFTGADDDPPALFPEKEGDFVRLTETDVPLVSEPMEIDAVDDSMRNTAVHSPSVPTGGIKKMSLSTYKSTNLRSVAKQIKLSTAPSQSLDVNFDNVPKVTDQEWLTAFLDDDHLLFGHTVLAETLTSQLKSSGSQGFQWLCSGTITSPMHGSSLEAIAEHLRVLSSGLFKTSVQYHLLVFPTRCDDFKVLTDFGVEPSTPDGITLKYFMFNSQQPICQLIRPFSDTSEGMQVEAGKEKVLLFPTLLNIRFSRLLDGSPRAKQKKHFFLAFPWESIEWFRSICSWLFVREPSCTIYSNLEPGGWAAFITNAKTEFGVAIFHEAMVPFVRRFPSLARLLQSNSNFKFWCFSETLGLESVQPEKRGWAPAMPPMFSRLFPLGRAILITPSFMVSQPQQTLAFLKWFFGTPAKQSLDQKLVTAYNITDYLRDLSGEKCAKQSLLKNTTWKQMNLMDVAVQKNNAALTDDDIEARQKAWFYFDRWSMDQPESAIPFSELNNVIYADSSIDPHDEQSLVNWFGWWSLTHSDEFRQFYVVGSSSSIDSVAGPLSAASRMSQNIKMPKYDQAVVNDPDEVIRTALRSSGETVGAGNGPRGTGRPRDSEAWFQSEFFKNNDNNIRAFLAQRDHRGGHLKVYNRPVSWADRTMADHFGDHQTQFATIEQWWNYALPWLHDHVRSFNTYIGFFYTIKEEWNSKDFPAGLRPRRHPWFVVYRPVDPHDSRAGFRHGKTELIIWDVRAGEELEESHSVVLSQLTWMQQELIRYIQLHAHEKNPGSFLERVWLGGFRVHQSTSQSTLAADITTENLPATTEHLKNFFPAAARLLITNGYRQVSLSPTAVATTSHADKKQQSGATDAEDNPDIRIIFHPPRGSEKIKPRGFSKCTNDLFEAARLARLRDKNATQMAYTFRPTLEWYQEQIAEGRQYEHITVDSWENIFERLHVSQRRGSKDDRVISSTTSEHSTAPSANINDSVGSNHSSPSF